MPDTLGYMVLGYAITVILLIALVGYLIIKTRNLRAELKMLKSLEEEGKALGETPASSVRDNTPQHDAV